MLESVRRYFRGMQRAGQCQYAFYQLTGGIVGTGTSRSIRCRSFTPGQPLRFCLRRTHPVAARPSWPRARWRWSITYLLRSEHSVVLWLVPSDAIREQT